MPIRRVILLVDDNPDTLSVRAFFLQNKGYRVITASDPVAAIDELQPLPRGAVRVAVVKLAFPTGTAASLFRAIKACDDELPILHLIEFPTPADALADRVLSDPHVSTKTLLEVIAELSRKKRGAKKKPVASVKVAEAQSWRAA